MMRFTHRPGWTVLAGAIATTALVFSACTSFKDQLLEPQNPGLIDASAVSSPAAAYALKVGAIGQVRNVVDCGGNYECLWEEIGNLTDEYHNADFQNTRQDIDQRQMTNDNPSLPWTSVTQNRGYVRDALDKMNQFLPDSVGDIGELYMSLAFLEMSLAENYCNGIPLGHTINGVVTYGTSLTTSQVLDSATTHVDSALSVNVGTHASAFIRQASLVLKARILSDKGQFAAAAALVPTSAVPSSFQYLFSSSASRNTDDLGIWQIVNSVARLSVSDSSEIVNGVVTVTKNALPFASANDPRVPIKAGSAVTPKIVAEDGTTPQFVQLIWGRDDPIAVVSGIDARLIEAEARLNANDIPGTMAILNALRAAPPRISVLVQPAPMAALPTPATQDAATTLFFREKAFWTFGRGQRLNDMRRQLRQYHRTEDQVYPTGGYFKGGTYGHTILFPVASSERTNPNFTGCIDTNP